MKNDTLFESPLPVLQFCHNYSPVRAGSSSTNTPISRAASENFSRGPKSGLRSFSIFPVFGRKMKMYFLTIQCFRRGQNTLKLKFTNASDAGNFDCQVSTNPKISQIFKLNIIGDIVCKISHQVSSFLLIFAGCWQDQLAGQISWVRFVRQ